MDDGKIKSGIFCALGVSFCVVFGNVFECCRVCAESFETDEKADKCENCVEQAKRFWAKHTCVEYTEQIREPRGNNGKDEYNAGSADKTSRVALVRHTVFAQRTFKKVMYAWGEQKA